MSDIINEIKESFKRYVSYNLNGNKINEDLLKEYGIDSYKVNGITYVRFNPNHEENVDTNSLINPKPFYNEVYGYPIYSIFQRKASKYGDGNPLLKALKGKDGYKFENPERDIPLLFRHYVYTAKALTVNFDTLIKVPSNNKLNQIFFNSIKDILHFNAFYESFLVKKTADEVWNLFINSDFYLKRQGNPEFADYVKELKAKFDKMNIENNGIFTYKYLNTFDRENINDTIKITDDLSDDMANNINDKNIILIDDTVTTGSTI